MKLSVAIPVYNVEAWLRECLDSLAAQTFTEWEAICVDDGSTDGSGTILDEYAAKDGRFRVVHQKNAGASAARNVALETARGEWVGFLDADDTVAPDWFERMMSHATEDVDIVHANSGVAFGSRKFRDDCTYRTFLRDGWSPLNLVRRSAIGAARYREGMRLKEDVVFFTELALATGRIAWVEEAGYNYRRRPGSAIAAPIAEADCVRFYRELATLRLPREDWARTIGYDLVQWIKGRSRSKKYDPGNCQVLDFWRKGVRSGKLGPGDVRFWWRPGLAVWLKTGSLWLLETTLFFRSWGEFLVMSAASRLSAKRRKGKSDV